MCNQWIVFKMCQSILSIVCFFIVDFICDYKEQVLITDVKNEKHCTICHVLSNQWKNLKFKWSSHTHEFIQQQIQRQRSIIVFKIDENWIHDVKKFAWKHHLINIHKSMLVNVLHQLLKNMIMHLFIWIKQLLQTKMSATRKRKNTCMIIDDRLRTIQLIAWFCKILEFIELKRFSRFSRMKQWIEIEEKTIVR